VLLVVVKRSSCIPTDHPDVYSGLAYTIDASRVPLTDRRSDSVMGGHAVDDRREVSSFGVVVVGASCGVLRECIMRVLHSELGELRRIELLVLLLLLS
jgi:hypothetical protein